MNKSSFDVKTIHTDFLIIVIVLIFSFSIFLQFSHINGDKVIT